MMPPPRPTRDLVLLGAGHAHVQVVKMLAMKAPEDLRITLISDSSEATYSGMLPACVAGHYEPEETSIELRRLTRWANVRFLKRHALGLDLDGKAVRFANHPAIACDVLSINIGSANRDADIPGVREHAIPTRPIHQLLPALEARERQCLGQRATVRVIILGAGMAGIELAFAMRARLRAREQPGSVTLLDSGPPLSERHSASVTRTIEDAFQTHDIQVEYQSHAVAVEPQILHRGGKTSLPFDLLLWASGASPPPFLKASGLCTDEAGFAKVETTLQSPGTPWVFAAGDCVHLEGHPPQGLPKAGVYAVRQGPVLAHNLLATLEGRTLKTYRPQKNFLSLLMTGDHKAIGIYGGRARWGHAMWRLKNKIDRRWISQFEDLDTPPMKTPTRRRDSPPEMRCAGCGSKVSASILDDVLRTLPIFDNPRIRRGLDRPDDAAVVKVPPSCVTVHTVDHFRAMTEDLHLLGRIISVHAASDLYAMGAKPDTALAVVTLAHASPKLHARDLKQLLTGIAEELFRMGATLIGGHTSEGSETSVGLSMTGLAEEDQLLTKDALQVGDQLVLTKPIGTGIVLAAKMQRQARGLWIDACYESMLVSNEHAVPILKESGVMAATDITGFGVLGHLREMLRPQGLGARLSLDQLPVLPGAESLASHGIASSLAPENEQTNTAALRVRGTHARRALLFDPQTAGGLMVGVKPETLENTLARLKEAGYASVSHIGEVTQDPGSVELTP